ncbi:MAG TPA: CpsB/CapC family capsule biosynthesis tyrosine phosphatase, partial [Baekduia sp.]|nr:CpsB/CapC family capsule biosynthesis tyrosine phosphatase [Baekduia sp.]
MRDPHTPLASLERELRGTEATAGTLIDLHTHVLPGIDDGPATVEEAVDLARAIADSGVSTVVATPHVSFEYRTTPAQILEARDALRDALDAAGIALELVTGAEVDLSYGIDLDDDALAELRLAGGPFLLVESPLSPAAGDFDPMLLGLQNRGHRV